MKWVCIQCGKERSYIPSIAKKRKYCSTRCQLNYEYSNGLRDKYEIGIKAREVSQAKMKKHNWLNDKSNRNNLKVVQQTEEYRLKQSISKLGEKNGMFGKKPSNYIDGKYRKWGNAYRGFGWKELKKKIKIRDEYSCQICGIKESDGGYLQVHHIVPYRIFEDNSDDNLITLCAKCHGASEFKFLKVNSIKRIEEKVKVYNISVDEDESYFAEGLAVHNCRSTIVFVPED